MAVSRKQYSAEFKQEAVRLITKGGLSAMQVSRDLGVNRTLLGKWKRQFEAAQQAQAQGRPDYVAFPGHGQAHDAELARLRRENTTLRMERDILKKAITIFAGPAGPPGK